MDFCSVLHGLQIAEYSQIIEQTGNTYKLEVNSVMEVLSNLEKQGVQVKNITQIHKTLEDVYNGFIQEASL